MREFSSATSCAAVGSFANTSLPSIAMAGTFKTPSATARSMFLAMSSSFQSATAGKAARTARFNASLRSPQWPHPSA